MHINAAAKSIMLQLHLGLDFYNVVYKIKPVLYIASVSAPLPTAPLLLRMKISVCALEESAEKNANQNEVNGHVSHTNMCYVYAYCKLHSSHPSFYHYTKSSTYNATVKI